MNKSIIATITFIFTILITSQTFARPGHRYDATSNSCRDFSQGELKWDSRVWGVGGKTFQAVCKSCHHRGNDQGATFLWVESKTSKGWNRILAQKKVKCASEGAWGSMLH